MFEMIHQKLFLLIETIRSYFYSLQLLPVNYKVAILFFSSHIFKNGDMDLSGGGKSDVANPLPNVAKLVDTGNGDEDEDDESSNR